MSRSTQLIGHTSEVSRFLSKCERLGKAGEVTGMFEEHVCDLHSYLDETSHVWVEFVQHEPWSSGPMIFLAIKRPPLMRETWMRDALANQAAACESRIMGWTPGESVGDREFDADKGLYWV